MLKVIHSAGGARLEKEVKSADFMLTNRRGGYLYLSSNENSSRFQGFYFYKYPFQLIKSLNSIKLCNRAETTAIINKFSSFEREYLNTDPTIHHPHTKESFFLSHDNTMHYKAENYTGDILLTFDCRKTYDFDDKGRIYKVYTENGILIIEYTKYKNDDLKEKEYTVFSAVKAKDSKNSNILFENFNYYSLSNEWVKENYSFDLQRNSNPTSLYVYNALKIKSTEGIELFFGFSEGKDEAIAKVHRLFEKILHEKNEAEHKELFLLKKNREFPAKEYQMAYWCALNSVDSLTQDIYGDFGVYAGLPWFFQFWARDEAISLGAFIKEHKYNEAKTIINRHLRHITTDGRISSLYPRSELASADGVGWTFFRLSELIEKLELGKNLGKYISHEELLHYFERLQYAIKMLLANHEDKGLIMNGKLETWMDTDFANDTREGKRIEIQCLFLVMLKLAVKLSSMLKDKDNEKFYFYLEDKYAERTRTIFLEGDALCDGLNDATQRPNVFLAYYLYPPLFRNSVWEGIFKNAISKLWLEWGGLSTIEKNSPLFCPNYTGENNRSYHRGDSWFFINNLSAIAMHRLNKRKFSKEIGAILNSSTSEILYLGTVGHMAELTSASKLESLGCQVQAWSAATLVELMHEISKPI